MMIFSRFFLLFHFAIFFLLNFLYLIQYHLYLFLLYHYLILLSLYISLFLCRYFLVINKMIRRLNLILLLMIKALLLNNLFLQNLLFFFFYIFSMKMMILLYRLFLLNLLRELSCLTFKFFSSDKFIYINFHLFKFFSLKLILNIILDFIYLNLNFLLYYLIFLFL